MAKTRPESNETITEVQKLISQLKTVQDEGKRSTASLKGMEKELEARDARLQEAEAKNKEAAVTIATTKDQVGLLLEENRRLAAGLDQVTKEVEQLRELAAGLKGESEKAVAESKSAIQARKELTDRIQSLERERTGLQGRLDLAVQQIASQGKVAALPASEVARMTDDLVGQIQSGFEGLRVRDGELKLKIAVAGIDKKVGFVVPTVESDPKLKDSLQELTIRFDKNTPLE